MEIASENEVELKKAKERQDRINSILSLLNSTLRIPINITISNTRFKKNSFERYKWAGVQAYD